MYLKFANRVDLKSSHPSHTKVSMRDVDVLIFCGNHCAKYIHISNHLKYALKIYNFICQLYLNTAEKNLLGLFYISFYHSFVIFSEKIFLGNIYFIHNYLKFYLIISLSEVMSRVTKFVVLFSVDSHL